MNISHNENERRFECRVDGGLAFAEYNRDGDTITFIHTEVPPEAAGKGVAGEIVSSALDYARQHELQVVPQCAYVKSYLKRHHEFDDIVHPEYR